MKTKLLTTPLQIRHQADIAVFTLGRCQLSENMTLNKLVNVSMVKGHKTILEYFDLAFYVPTISYLSHCHIIRHRLTTPMVQSQRYTSTFEIVAPDAIKSSEAATQAYFRATAKSFETYNYLINKRNVKKEDARYVLPQGVKIELVLKCNLREFMHIVELRTAPDALQETQDVVNAMLAEVKNDDILGRFFE